MPGADKPQPSKDAGAWLRLDLTPKLGPAAQRKLLSVRRPTGFGCSSSGVDSRSRRSARCGAAYRRRCRTHKHRTLDWLPEPGNHLLTLADEQYPRRLLETVDPPLLLFVKGRVGLLDQPALAVVGSRNATLRGAPDAQALAQVPSDAGLTSSAALPSVSTARLTAVV
jgi:DNA processing protein